MALYHLTENGNVYINYAVSQQPRAATTSPLRSLAAVTVPTAPILNRKKPTPARLAPNGRFWINVCCSPPRCSALISKMKLSKMMTELTRNTVRNASKAMRYPWREYHSRVAGDWRLYPAKSNHQKRQRCCPGWFLIAAVYRSTPSPYGANIRQPTISLLARAHAISAVCIKVQTARWERQRLPKVTGSPMPNWGIELIAISTSS